MTINLSALEADLEAAPTTYGQKCALQALAAEHPEAEAVLRRAVLDVHRSAARVSQILTRNGLKISEASIKRHRQGICTRCKEGTNP